MKATLDSALPFEQLLAKANKLGVPLAMPEAEQIEKFASLLRQWNERVNLVADTSPATLLNDHILDSLSLVPLIGTNKMKLIDIGCGAGFPGLILAIAMSNLHVTLVECTGKKTRFLEEAVSLLGLIERVSILNDRAESLAHISNFRHQFDLATCRAVGNLDLVLELTSPFLKPQGRSLLQRSLSQYEREKNDQAKNLGADLQETIFPDRETLGKKRVILIFSQLTITKAKYPRPWNKIKKSNASS